MRLLGVTQKVRASGVTQEVHECCCDVPLIDSLQALLKCKSVCEQVRFPPLCQNINLKNTLTQIFNSHMLDGGKMGDYCDGEQYKQHPLFKEDPCALQIRLYYDDLEICNALGSKVKKHKLGKFKMLRNYVLAHVTLSHAFLVHVIGVQGGQI